MRPGLKVTLPWPRSKDPMKLKKESQGPMYGLRLTLKVIIASYALGWMVLALQTRRLPFLDPFYWRLASVIMLCLTLWLALSLSLKALVWWTTTALAFASVRSISYLIDGIYSPFGVWLLVLSGIAVTVLAVISVEALTNRFKKGLYVQSD